MLWRADERAIDVLYLNGPWVRYEDTWDDTQPTDDPSLTPPEGLVQPMRGFGKVWREQLGGPQAQIGWALEPEQGYDMLRQSFDFGDMYLGLEGEVFILYNDGAWEGDEEIAQ